MKPLLDTIFAANCRLSNNSSFWERTRLNSIGRATLRAVANHVLPCIYRISRGRHTQEVVPVIVSLTSFPARIGRLWIVIESMLRQRVRAEQIILWLSRDQFPKEYDSLPPQLRRQTSRGLTIRFVDGDYRSHKKYYYAMQEFADKYILTIDDDLLFPSDFIDKIYSIALRHPDSVVGSFGSKIKWNPETQSLDKIHIRITPLTTGHDLFFGSGGGTLFPPARLQPYLNTLDTIYSLCPTADDIYLNAISRLAGLNVTFQGILPLLSIKNKGDQKLTDHNGNLFSPTSRNSDQLRAIISHCLHHHGINPFVNQ